MKKVLTLLGMVALLPLGLSATFRTELHAQQIPLRAVAVSDSAIRLSWSGRFDAIGAMRLERSEDGKHFLQVALMPATTNRFAGHYTDEGLIPATTYYYRLCDQEDSAGPVYSKVSHARTRGGRRHLSLVLWGNSVGDPPPKLENLVAVAAGEHHQMALLSNGKVVVWGDANSTNGQVKFPADLKHVTAIAAGGFHSLALKSDGTVVAWGVNTNGQSTPPPGLKKVVAIAAGENHSLALKADGTVVGWGDDTYGQSDPPTNLNHVVAIAAGGDHSLALKSDGTVTAWGFMLFRPPPPVQSNIVAIAAGSYHDLLLKRDGTVVPWVPWYGNWYYDFPPPGLSNVVAIAAGENRNLALKADGTVVAWGDYRYESAQVPEGLSRVAFIGAGAYSSLALTALPAPPLQLMARATTTNRATLTWVDNCTDEDSYIVERATNLLYWTPGDWMPIAKLHANSTHYVDFSVAPGEAYWYRVRARNHRGVSPAPSASYRPLALLPPALPGNPYAVIGRTNCVILAWSDYVWQSGTPDGYTVQRAPDVAGAPGAWSDIATVRDDNTSVHYFADTNAQPFQSYWYRLRAFNVFGVSDDTGAVNITVDPPPAPIIAAASPFADRVNLNWYLDNPFTSGMDKFEVERAPDVAGSPGAWSPLATLPVHEPYTWSYSYTDAGHALNTTWWYRVRTHNWIGYGPYSDPISATIVLPAAPTWLSGWLGGSNRVKLQWQEYPADQQGFRIERAPDAGGQPGQWNEIGILGLTNSSAAFTDFQVTAPSTNWYRVRAFNQLGLSAYSTNISVAAVPPPPPQLTVAPFRDEFVLQFNVGDYHFDAGNFDGYKIERAPDVRGSPGDWTEIGQTLNESFTDAGHALDTTCWYRVRAFNWAGDGDYSTEVHATILPPGAPESLTVLIGTTNRIELSWNDIHGDQDGFNVERAPDAGGAPGNWTEIARLTTNVSYVQFTDTNSPTQATNWYRVRAFNLVGLSAYCDPASVAVVPPPAPGYSGTSVNRDTVDFNWNGYYGSYGLVERFKVERAPDEGGSPGAWQEIAQTSGDEYHFTDPGRPVNTTWWYRARACNWIGDGEPSPAASAVIIPPAPPYPVNGLIGASNQVDLSWFVPQMDEDGFRLERAPDSGGIPGPWTEIADIPGTNSWSGSWSDTNVTALSTNWYRVRTYNVLGNSAYSTPTSVAVLPPRSPNSLWTQPSRDQVILNWGAYYGDYGHVDGFKIERAPDVGGNPGQWSQIGILSFDDANNNGMTYIDSGRALNTTWWYRVRAYNWVGDSPYCSPASATIQLSTAPTDLAVRIGSTNQVILSWQQWSTDEDGFRVERAADAGGVPGAWSEIGFVSATNASYAEFTDTNVTALTTNWYRVQAFNILGYSDFSEAQSVAVVPPPSPDCANAQAQRDRIELSWCNPGYEYWYGAISGFKVERAPDAGGLPGVWTEVGRTDNSTYNYTDSNLVLNTTWWYRVRAYNWVGDSEASPETSATITPPAAPDWVQGRIGSTNEVNLTWQNSGNDSDGFRVERASDAGGMPGPWTEIGVVLATNVTYGYFTDTNASALSTNWYRVRAFNALAESDYAVSDPVAVIPPPAPNVSASVYRDQARLSWYFNYGYDYGQVSGFQIERAADEAGIPGAWTQIATVNVVDPNVGSYTYTDAGLPVNTGFWYRVRTFNWIGSGTNSPATKITILPPTTPGPLYAQMVGATNQVSLNWYDDAHDEDGFMVESAADIGGVPGSWAAIAVVPATNFYSANYTVSNVMAYTTNWYRVRAYSSLGLSDYCSPASVNITPPDAPGYIHAYNYYSGMIILFWQANSVASGYELQRAPDNNNQPGNWASIAFFNSSSSSYYEDHSLVASGSYWYRVRSANWVGQSAWSPSASVFYYSPPTATTNTVNAAISNSNSAPRIQSLLMSNMDVVISWEALGGTTNVVQATTGLTDGFEDISAPLFINGTGIVSTNYLDSGARTNASPRFYRIKVR
jgi:titin